MCCALGDFHGGSMVDLDTVIHTVCEKRSGSYDCVLTDMELFAVRTILSLRGLHRFDQFPSSPQSLDNGI